MAPNRQPPSAPAACSALLGACSGRLLRCRAALCGAALARRRGLPCGRFALPRATLGAVLDLGGQRAQVVQDSARRLRRLAATSAGVDAVGHPPGDLLAQPGDPEPFKHIVACALRHRHHSLLSCCRARIVLCPSPGQSNPPSKARPAVERQFAPSVYGDDRARLFVTKWPSHHRRSARFAMRDREHSAERTAECRVPRGSTAPTVAARTVAVLFG